MRRHPARPILLAAPALALVLGCATTNTRSNSLVPTRYRTDTGPYAIYTNFPLDSDAPAVLHLRSLQRQIEGTLGVRVEPGDSPIEVFILDDRKAFTHFLTYYYPELPPRRAFFFAQGTKRVVYAYHGDRLEEDLRHEATHALLHAAFANLPLWLDEGLAEYFEVGEEADGLNLEHLERLPGDLAKGWTPDLERLESLRDVRQMTPRDYRESWAWVHYLLHGNRRNQAELLAHLAAIRDGIPGPPLAERIGAAGSPTGPSESPLITHIGLIRDQRRQFASGGEPPASSTVRLQNASLQSASLPPPRRRGFFGRMVDSLFRKTGEEESPRRRERGLH